MNNQPCPVCLSPSEPCHDCRVKSMRAAKGQPIPLSLPDIYAAMQQAHQQVAERMGQARHPEESIVGVCVFTMRPMKHTVLWLQAFADATR